MRLHLRTARAPLEEWHGDAEGELLRLEQVLIHEIHLGRRLIESDAGAHVQTNRR